MAMNRQTKIIATLGPRSSSVDMVKKLINAGLNVARVNMSHGDHQEQSQKINNIRQASSESGKEVAILLDLQGPKIRVDKLQASLELKQGETWLVGETSLNKKYTTNFIPTTYQSLVNDCEAGARILFDDGHIIAEVIDKNDEVATIKIISGGTLIENKGINLPDSIVSVACYTAKDDSDLKFGLEHQIDYIALSFVRTKEDVITVKKVLQEYNAPDIPIISKIENPQGIDNLEEILEVSDMIMVARGDMGVELGNHLVPSIQKRIIRKCNDAGIPVITATQMLESMSKSMTPTRAEASDVANAIWDGTDAVMLSGETAMGDYPLETLIMMDKIIEDAEKTPKSRRHIDELILTETSDALSFAASLTAEKVGAKKIISFTQSGSTCLKITQHRPKLPIVGVTNKLPVARKMCLYWGVVPFYIDNDGRTDASVEYEVIQLVRNQCNLKAGQKVVITRGEGIFFKNGTSNSMRILTIRDQFKARS